MTSESNRLADRIERRMAPAVPAEAHAGLRKRATAFSRNPAYVPEG